MLHIVITCLSKLFGTRRIVRACFAQAILTPCLIRPYFAPVVRTLTDGSHIICNVVIRTACFLCTCFAVPYRSFAHTCPPLIRTPQMVRIWICPRCGVIPFRTLRLLPFTCTPGPSLTEFAAAPQSPTIVGLSSSVEKFTTNTFHV